MDKGCEDMSGKKNNFLEFFQKNKKQTLIGGGVAVVIIAAAVSIGIFAGRGAKPASAGDAQTGTQAVSGETAANTETEKTDIVPLEENAVPEVNELLQQYYQAAADGDMDTLNTLVNTYDEDTQIYLEKMSGHIEYYQNVACYTKPGPVDGSYIVYAYYEVKFKDLDTAVPGISPYLVYPKEDGSLYIYEGDVDESVNAYVEEVSAQDDVIDLMNRVQVVFNEAVMQDDNLNNYLAQLKEDLQVEVGEALGEAESRTQEETADAEETSEAPATGGGKVRATDVVNVRASDSEQAERIGKVAVGDVMPLLEEKANGWSKVEYDGKEGYIKSEFLESVDENSEKGENPDADGAKEEGAVEESSSETSQNAAPGSELPATGKIKVAETVNIRKSCSETADKVGTVFPGETLEIVMQQADGWTRVKYNGQTGYVKTEVLKVLK